MQTIIYGDDPVFVQSACLCSDGPSTVITDSAALPRLHLPPGCAPVEYVVDLFSPDVFSAVTCRSHVRFMLCFATRERQDRAISLIQKEGFTDTSFILIQHDAWPSPAEERDGIFRISTSSLVQEHICTCLKKLKNIQRIEQLKKINKAAGTALILLQHDPDPDALASGLALRTLLERKRNSAPLGSFGEITRSENINMVRVLDIPVLKVAPDMLDKFSLIAMVDVQPPYFLDTPIPRCDIVIDHHPYARSYAATYSDVRTGYGATSTILGEYLIDAKVGISQRLATALVYGIKTDTMSLERDISQADLEVFTHLYTSANLSMIRQIESPALEMAEIQIFIKALQHLRLIGTMACTWLGHIRHVDMIPRLADFSLQVAGAEWSFAAGISRGMVVCSVRNVGYVQHAGELMHSVFGSIGSAGGHRSTAKAVVPVTEFKKKYGLSISADIPDALFSALQEAHRQAEPER